MYKYIEESPCRSSMRRAILLVAQACVAAAALLGTMYVLVHERRRKAKAARRAELVDGRGLRRLRVVGSRRRLARSSLGARIGWRRAWRNGGRCARGPRGAPPRRVRGREGDLRWDVQLCKHVYSHKACDMTHMCAIYNRVPM